MQCTELVTYTLYIINNLMDALIMCISCNRKLLNQQFFKLLTVRVFKIVFLKNEAGIYLALIIYNSVIQKIYFKKSLVVFEMFVNDMIQNYILYCMLQVAVLKGFQHKSNPYLVTRNQKNQSRNLGIKIPRTPEFTLMKIQCCGPLKYTCMYMLCVYGCILS